MSPEPKYIAVCTLLALVFAACLGEAPHSNPLDPQADEFEEVGRIEGTTTRFYPPFSSVEEAEVRLTPGPLIARSDADGRFSFDRVPVGEYQIEATKNGFESSSQTLQVASGSTTTGVQIRLDGLPIIKQAAFRSTHISRWFPPDDLFLLEGIVLVEDADGLSDLDRVWFEMLDFAFSHQLGETGVAGRYEVALPADSLPGRNLFALQGAEIWAQAIDDAGFQTEAGPFSIVRVIEHTPIAVEPQGQERVSTTPTFTWEDSALPYDYTYRVDVVRDQANVQTVVRIVEDIPQDSTTYTIETPLPDGTYFWTISVVDAHGNRSRSKEAGFIVP